MNYSSPDEHTDATPHAPDQGPTHHAGSRASTSLGRSAAKGSRVSILGQLARMGVQFVGVVVLSRILMPVDFGYLAIVMALVAVGELLRDFGLSTAAIQAQHLSTAQRDTLFWINCGIGLALATVSMLMSGLVARVFGEPTIGPILRAVSLTFLLNGIASQYRANLTREMRFTALAVTEVLSLTFAVTAAIVAAINGFGYWALVIQQIVLAATALCLVVIFGRWVPHLPRRNAGTRDLLRFGRDLLSAQVVAYFATNADTLILGLRSSAAQVGLYNRAFQLVMVPLGQLKAPATTVALPVLSRLQEDGPIYTRYLSVAQTALGYMAVPVAALIAGTTAPVVFLVFGPRWEPAIPLARILALAGILQLLSYVSYWIFLSKGLGAQLRNYTLVASFIKILSIVALSGLGAIGVAGGYLVGLAVTWPISLWWAARSARLPFRTLLVPALRILGIALPAAALAHLATLATAGAHPLVQFAAGGVAVSSTYALAGLLFTAYRTDLRTLLWLARSAWS